ncbi:MAG: hypothetical protein OEO83_01280 [Alphaproteobacteria bacterium]|nr:hypothetical protein [Alphaproteobacteria bacterium]
MIAMFRKPEKVRGVIAPRRRFTVWAALYFVLFVALPVLAIAFALDTAVYFAVDRPFGTCLAVLCWAG